MQPVHGQRCDLHIPNSNYQGACAVSSSQVAYMPAASAASAARRRAKRAACSRGLRRAPLPPTRSRKRRLAESCGLRAFRGSRVLGFSVHKCSRVP